MALMCPNCHYDLPVSADDAVPPAACPQCGCTWPTLDQETAAPARHTTDATAWVENLRIEGCEIRRVIGRGGMGVVLEAWQSDLERRVAVKVLGPDHAQDGEFVERFVREAKALARVKHPHIVAIYGSGRSGDLPYFIMEYVEGLDGGPPVHLGTLSRQGLSESRVRELILQVVQALGFAHQHGIIHRDVKPGNVMVDQQGQVRVVDFGIAAVRTDGADSELTSRACAMGTERYMAPEQRRDASSVDGRADVYATGVILFEMLCRERFVLGASPPPSRLRPDIDPGWDTIVARATAASPDERIPTMAEFERLLKGCEPSAVASRCGACGHAIAESDQYCAFCQAPLWRACPGCQAKVRADAKFCPSCRMDLDQSAQFEENVARGQEQWQLAQAAAAARERLQHAQAAALMFAAALRLVPGDTRARTLRDQANQLAATTAWDLAEEDSHAKRLGEAERLYGEVLEHAADHPKARRRLEAVGRARTEALTKSQLLLDDGQAKAACQLLEAALQAFPDDPQIAAALQEAVGRRDRILELVERRLPALKQEKRWWAIHEHLVQIQEAGLSIRGLEAYREAVERGLAKAREVLAAAETLLRKGQYDEAERQVAVMLDAVSDHPAALSLRRLIRRQRYLNATAVVSVLLALLAAAGSYTAGRMAWAEPLGARPADWPLRVPFWAYPAAVMSLGTLAALLPGRRRRGTGVLVVALLAAAGWVYLARSLPAGFGAGVWVMLGVVLIWVGIAAFNLCRSLVGVAAVAAPCATLAGVGCCLLLAERAPTKPEEPPAALVSGAGEALPAVEPERPPPPPAAAVADEEQLAREACLDALRSRGQQWLGAARPLARALADRGWQPAPLAAVLQDLDRGAVTRAMASWQQLDASVPQELRDFSKDLIAARAETIGRTEPVAAVARLWKAVSAEGDELAWKELRERLGQATVQRAAAALDAAAPADALQLLTAADENAWTAAGKPPTARLLARAVWGVLTGQQACLVTPDGTFGLPPPNAELDAALARAAKWDPALANQDALLYSRLLVQGGPVAAVARFADERPEWRPGEVHCYLGLHALDSPGLSRLAEAERHFARAAEAASGSGHQRLAKLGCALVSCRRTPSADFYARAAAERAFFLCSEGLAGRDIMRHFPTTEWKAAADLAWRDSLEIVATSPRLDELLARNPLPYRVLWVQLTKAQVGEDRRELLQKWVTEGGVLWTDTDLARQPENRVPDLKTFGFRMVSQANVAPPPGVVMSRTQLVVSGVGPRSNVALSLPSLVRPGLVVYFGAVQQHGRGKLVFRPSVMRPEDERLLIQVTVPP